jgi:hypothetical protein
MLSRRHISRILEDRLRASIAGARAGDAAFLPPAPWSDDLPIGPGGLSADSLELLTLAGAVNGMFHIHDIGIVDGLLARRHFGAWVDLAEQSWKLNSGRISFQSSGSTGRPRRCTHPLASLLAEAGEHAAELKLASPGATRRPRCFPCCGAGRWRDSRMPMASCIWLGPMDRKSIHPMSLLCRCRCHADVVAMSMSLPWRCRCHGG